ncbi:TPA: hypothetical protein DCZ46_01240 [Candidatus Campbellbacteria bacterium]|nr:MAG: seg [Candidatus Campbellbacteria bacterium GW2011_OD1_34_28]KKP75290.1 MAG: hypothetical protein UR74_C0001G0146 [Candidatus Campbellbacteria bacterium GW2011_GWD2_35_24]KKP76149.1 MAG: protein of unknown function with transmembrane region [Candidatus Campbellbacteria bacterium GW2011_GWC2_35_28]KKP77338.1 MAG: hypothetical protein UR76_C0001G0183 [Candidatus Campbellbacteria bacterium GW2011_GWC1_35_31]KKP79267.1 MAG: hypothetical protein UR79_C0001G0183 [Candidatus Campbellbacteria ba
MKKVFNKKIKVYLGVLFVFSFVFVSFADAVETDIESYVFGGSGIGSLPELLTMKLSNRIPSPNEEITISLENYSIDLYTSQISWYKNDSLVERGLGKKDFTFNVGGLGTSDTITAVVLTKNGEQISTSKTFSPAEVDIVWEGDVYTPPFYKGKALVSHRSVVKIVAIPNFIGSNKSKISDDKLMYVWKKNGNIINGSQGMGKNMLYYDMEKNFRDSVLTVEVSNSDDSIKAKSSVSIKEIKPKIVFYENDPLMGIVFEKALNKKTDLLKEEITVTAQPFFFSKDDIKNEKLEYKWKLNNKILDDVVGDFITLKKGEDKGTANLSLNIQDKNRVMQSATNILNINFDDERASLFNF